ncbi:hypothetical protein [Povalibacter sp.]|uniref:hypothetical protein n=1 Tax=Povalibacter sp. TaxID=1962978 RepID=UPI002F41B73D
MRNEIEFRSHVSRKHRVALEGLVFFNSCQARVAACIADAVEMFGAPEIVPEDPDRLRLRIAGMQEAQCLFAVDKETGKPVGVAIYIRPDLEHITVLHLSIAAEYASGGLFSDEHLLLRLLREVRRSTRRMKGVRRLELYYGRNRTPRWSDAEAALATG